MDSDDERDVYYDKTYDPVREAAAARLRALANPLPSVGIRRAAEEVLKTPGRHVRPRIISPDMRVPGPRRAATTRKIIPETPPRNVRPAGVMTTQELIEQLKAATDQMKFMNALTRGEIVYGPERNPDWDASTQLEPIEDPIEQFMSPPAPKRRRKSKLKLYRKVKFAPDPPVPHAGASAAINEIAARSAPPALIDNTIASGGDLAEKPPAVNDAALKAAMGTSEPVGSLFALTGQTRSPRRGGNV